MDQAKLKDALIQTFLRMIPLVPANEFKAVIDAIRKTETDIDKDVEDAITAIRKSSELIISLENKLAERSALLEKLKNEHKRLSELTSITKEQTAALSEALRETIGTATRRERAVSLLINLIAGVIVFLLGVVFGPRLTAWLGGLF
jgi:chromosome segregation ATPase